MDEKKKSLIIRIVQMCDEFSDSYNPYSLLPTELVIQLVGSLENLRAYYFHKIVYVPSFFDSKLYTIFRIRDNYVDYVIVESPFAGDSTSTNPIVGSDFRFFSVNYASDGTLIQSLIMDNVVEVPIIVIRTNMTSVFRDTRYDLNFKLYQFGNPSEQKETICNLFALPGFSFVLYGYIFLRLTFIEFFPIISFEGKLDHKQHVVDSVFVYDYANGTILGIVESQLIFFWNDKRFSIVNFYPDLQGTTYSLNQQPVTIPIDTIIGGQNNFIVERRENNVTSDNEWNIIAKGSKGKRQALVGNEPTGGKIRYTSLKEFILINQSDRDKILYLIAFTNLKPGLNAYPMYGVIGFSNFLDTQSKLRTFPIRITFKKTYDPETYQNYESIWFRYTPDMLFIYETGFEKWRTLNAGSISLNDVNMTLLQSEVGVGTFNALENRNNDIETNLSYTFDTRFVTKTEEPPYEVGYNKTESSRSLWASRPRVSGSDDLTSESYGYGKDIEPHVIKVHAKSREFGNANFESHRFRNRRAVGFP